MLDRDIPVICTVVVTGETVVPVVVPVTNCVVPVGVSVEAGEDARVPVAVDVGFVVPIQFGNRRFI